MEQQAQSDLMRISVIAIACFGLFRSPDPAIFQGSCRIL
jgi:hypothetical protein